MTDGDDRERLYQHARTETARIMGVDPKRLTSTQAMKLDMATSLRIALDNLQGRVIAGQSTDIAALITASETLAKLLPALAVDEPTAVQCDDARAKLAALIEGAIAAQEYDAERGVCSECERLREQVSELEARIRFIQTNAPLRDPDQPPSDQPPPLLPPEPASSPASSSPSPWNPPPAPSAPADRYAEGQPSDWRRFIGVDGSIRGSPLTGGWPWS
jgi:hypothetical protein